MLSRKQKSRAYYSEHGLLCWCTTTAQLVLPRRVRLIDGILWCDCPACDTSRGVGAAYDARRPQPHPALMEVA